MKGVGGYWSHHWCHHLALIIILALLWKGSDSESLPGYSINAEDEVSAQLGLCVHVPCTFNVSDNKRLTPNATGLWYKGLISPDNLVASKTGSGPNTHQRFILTGDVRNGDCSFSILDVQRDDESRYRFRVEDTIIFNYEDIKRYVRVKDVTDKPVISPISSLVAGKEVTLTCLFLGRCSESQQNIGWSGSTSHQNVSDVRDTVSNKDGSTTYYSNLTFTPSREAHGSSISCEMTYVYSRNTIRANVTLDVQYNPKPDDDERLQCLFNESHVECTCVLQSAPLAAIKWVFDSKEYLDSRGSSEELTIMINHIKDLHNNGQKCRSSIISSYLDSYRTEETVFRNMSTTLIVVIVIGNIVILSLIGLGLLCYIKRTRKNTPNGKGSNNLEMTAEGPESDYQVLEHQTHDIYNSLKK